MCKGFKQTKTAKIRNNTQSQSVWKEEKSYEPASEVSFTTSCQGRHCY